jgi:phosphoribosylanthranilate isomerase
VRLKICGIRTQADLQLCLEANADAVGFVVEYPVPVPWDIDRTIARELISYVPPYTTSVLVTTGTPEKVVELLEYLRPNVVQLHGDETIEDVRSIVKKAPGIRIIKAMRISVSESKNTEEVLSLARDYAECGIAGLLLDSKTDTMPAGTGVPLDWQTARCVVEQIKIPVILAGGITRENVEQAVQTVKPYAIDLISAVETTPGIKDPQKLRAFAEHFRKICN